MAETILPAAAAPSVAGRPALGYAMAAAAATLFGINGSVAKVVIRSGLAADRLTELRCTGALAGLALVAALTHRPELRVRRRELLFLAAFGVGGVALVQWTYFVAIGRLNVGVALLIQYVAPLLVALWARFGYHEHVRRRVWLALALSLGGLVLVVRLWNGLTLDGIGLAAGVGSMVTFAFYLLLAERGVRRRSAVPLLAWGFLFATVFWSAVLPWWSFPGNEVASSTSLLGRLDSLHLPVAALVAWVVLLGTIAPFILIVGALRYVPATRVAIVAMLEPVTATLVAWLWLRETLGPTQLVGAAVVLAGIALAQTAR
jgi:drug/metabolite transporter (DMT)-like permease